MAKDETLLSLTKQGVIRRDLSEGKGKFPASFDTYRLVEANQLVFCLFDVDETPRTVGLAHERGMVTGAYDVFAVNTSIATPQYLEYYFIGIDNEKRFRPLYTGLRKVIQKPRFKSAPIMLPPLNEQQAIADYLDRETRKIDELITEQRGLIETLRERRHSLVTRAVTLGIGGKGLASDEDQTIGNVPIGWEVRPLKAWMKSLNDIRIPLSATERADRSGDYDYYGASGVIDYVNDYLFAEPLVLVSEDGANLLLRSTPIAFVATGKYWVNNHAHVFRPNDGEVRFWSERIEAVDVAPFVTGSAQPKLTAGALGRIRLSAPVDLAERRRISAYLDEQTSRIDELISESEDLIALSQERRAALITAAVTGQIDVRTAA